MSDTRAAHRYATAIAEVAAGPDEIERLYQDFRMIEDMLEQVREFPLFLRNPVIAPLKKRRAMEALLAGKVHPTMLKFVLLLVSKGREALLPSIIREFYSLRDKRLGIIQAAVRSAVPFTRGEKTALLERLERVTRKQVHIRWVKDPALVGGFVVEMEDKVWDASVRHQLDALKDRLARGAA